MTRRHLRICRVARSGIAKPLGGCFLYCEPVSPDFIASLPRAHATLLDR